VRNRIVKAVLDHYKIIGRYPVLAVKMLEALAALITPSTIVHVICIEVRFTRNR
jgi:hypothetical protein